MSHDIPYRWVGRTARVFGVIARSTADGDSVNVDRIDIRENRRQARDARDFRHDPERQRRAR